MANQGDVERARSEGYMQATVKCLQGCADACKAGAEVMLDENDKTVMLAVAGKFDETAKELQAAFPQLGAKV